jgi:hypothetical protein
MGVGASADCGQDRPVGDSVQAVPTWTGTAAGANGLAVRWVTRSGLPRQDDAKHRFGGEHLGA